MCNYVYKYTIRLLEYLSVWIFEYKSATESQHHEQLQRCWKLVVNAYELMTEAAAFGALTNDVGGAYSLSALMFTECVYSLPTVLGATATAVHRSHLSRPASSSAFPKPHFIFWWILFSLLFCRYIYYEILLNKKAELSQRCTRDATYIGYGCSKNFFGSPLLSLATPTPTFTEILMGFCCDRSKESAYKIWTSYLYRLWIYVNLWRYINFILIWFDLISWDNWAVNISGYAYALFSPKIFLFGTSDRPVNVPAKFEVLTFTHSWDNSDCSFECGCEPPILGKRRP